MSDVPMLTKEQQFKLAEAYTEFCGTDPDSDKWKSELAEGKRQIRDILSYWKKREKRGQVK